MRTFALVLFLLAASSALAQPRDGTCTAATEPQLAALGGAIADAAARAGSCATVYRGPFESHEREQRFRRETRPWLLRQPNAWALIAHNAASHRAQAWRQRTGGAPDQLSVQESVAQELLTEMALADPVANERIRSISDEDLLRAWQSYQREFGSLARNETFLSRFRDGGREAVVQWERVRLEVQRRVGDRIAGQRLADGAIPASVRDRVLGVFRRAAENGYSLEDGFSQDLGDGFRLSFLRPGLSAPGFLVLEREAGERSGTLSLISLEARPSVVRLDWQPAPDLQGSVELLGARGTLDVGTGGVNAELMAYLGAAQLEGGPITLEGYAGGIGVVLEFRGGRLRVGCAAGVGGSVSINFVDAGEMLLRGAEALLRPRVYAGPNILDYDTTWIDDPRHRDGGYYQTSMGTRISRSAFRALVASRGIR